MGKIKKKKMIVSITVVFIIIFVISIIGLVNGHESRMVIMRITPWISNERLQNYKDRYRQEMEYILSIDKQNDSIRSANVALIKELWETENLLRSLEHKNDYYFNIVELSLNTKMRLVINEQILLNNVEIQYIAKKLIQLEYDSIVIIYICISIGLGLFLLIFICATYET